MVSLSNHCGGALSLTPPFDRLRLTPAKKQSMKLLYVYILECSDKSYYVGVTNDVERRVYEHNQGLDHNAYTFLRKPVKCVFVSEGMTPDDAIDFEKQVKGWRREKKEALIRNQWEKLPELSMNYKKKKESDGLTIGSTNSLTGSPDKRGHPEPVEGIARARPNASTSSA